jgi:hypothetical protein
MSNEPFVQPDEQSLSDDLPDEALERAAAPERAQAMSFSFCTSVYVCPWWR